MANRRMFSLDIVDTDKFLDMPISAQCLYFHLGMRADDDGFISSPKQIMRMTTCTQGDMRILIENGFIIPFESGIVVIRHWKQHNYIQSDRYRKTKFTEERSRLELTNNVYMLDTENIQTVSSTEAQYRLSKDIVRDRDRDRDRDNNITNYQEIISMYNDTCVSFPKVNKLSEKRKKTIKARLNIYSLDDFKKLFEMAEASRFLKGQNNRNWIASFDWLICDANMAKVLDGNYQDRDSRQQSTETNEPYSQQAIYDEMYKGLVRLEGEEDVFA